jgi:peptide methionine sulfoxide reductase msrA/msrB
LKNVTSILVVLIAISCLFLFGLSKQTAHAYQPTPKADLDVEISASKHIDSIVLGAGCFWGAEKRYAAIPGVIDSVSGYADGHGIKPTYREITKRSNRTNPNNHAEVVKVTFNTSMTSLEAILQNYFEGHDPTQLNRQGNDKGTQYRSTILTNSEQQLLTAKKVLSRYQTLLTEDSYGQITTLVKPISEFFPAENYHQDYLAKNPNGYCPDHSTGVKFDSSQSIAKVDNSSLLQGKQIIVIESAGYCPYCEKFKTNVVKDYKGAAPITFRLAPQLQGLQIKTPTWATPTILFINDGKEVFGQQGYMSPEKFYSVLEKFSSL